jgi:hypothetical protein
MSKLNINTGHNRRKLEQVRTIINDLSEYWPLTLRQVFYQLVGQGICLNNRSQYQGLSQLLTQARILGEIEWDCIEDRARRYIDLTGYIDGPRFIESEAENVLSGYTRNLQQTQENYIEIFVEKDALATLFRKVAEKYCISVTTCRGYISADFVNKYKRRTMQNADRRPVVLYFGDFDPSGLNMSESLESRMLNDFNIPVNFIRPALNVEQIEKYNLPHVDEDLKRGDSRAANHVKKYGFLAVELDALKPPDLSDIIHNAIQKQLNIDAFNFEVERYMADIDRIKKIRETCVKFMRRQAADLF